MLSLTLASACHQPSKIPGARKLVGGGEVKVQPSPSPVPSPIPPTGEKVELPTLLPELRGTWITSVDSKALFSKDALQEAFSHMKSLNFNTAYPVVWNAGHTLYPSQVAEKTFGVALDPRPEFQGRDILKESVSIAKENKIRVLAWFEYGLKLPSRSKLAALKPHWITSKSDGSKEYDLSGTKVVWMNPFHPEVQSFLTDLILESVTQYDIDGIQIDDHFGLGAEFGYDEFTKELYKAENKGTEPPKDHKNAEWIKWRADKITGFIVKLTKALKAARPTLVVSVSPNPYGFAYEKYLQDWVSWYKKASIDEIVLQVYRTDDDKFQAELMRPEVQEAKAAKRFGVGILSGLRNSAVNINVLERQTALARKLGFAGVSFFFFESLLNFHPTESAETRQKSLEMLFPPLPTTP
jgi:uncharacterized lipoprotein YddW (UPF0748 family)